MCPYCLPGRARTDAERQLEDRYRVPSRATPTCFVSIHDHRVGASISQASRWSASSCAWDRGVVSASSTNPRRVGRSAGSPPARGTCSDPAPRAGARLPRAPRTLADTTTRRGFRSHCATSRSAAPLLLARSSRWPFAAARVRTYVEMLHEAVAGPPRSSAGSPRAPLIDARIDAYVPPRTLGRALKIRPPPRLCADRVGDCAARVARRDEDRYGRLPKKTLREPVRGSQDASLSSPSLRRTISSSRGGKRRSPRSCSGPRVLRDSSARRWHRCLLDRQPRGDV